MLDFSELEAAEQLDEIVIDGITFTLSYEGSEARLYVNGMLAGYGATREAAIQMAAQWLAERS